LLPQKKRDSVNCLFIRVEERSRTADLLNHNQAL
jgi:hypothetical protein